MMNDECQMTRMSDESEMLRNSRIRARHYLVIRIRH